LQASSNPVAQISVEALKELLDRDENVTLLDVRERFEREHCSIPVPPGIRDLFIPLNEIPGRIEELQQLDQATLIVVYCHHGVRSMHAAHWLSRQRTWRLANLDGGIDDWSVRIDPQVLRY